MIQDLRVEYVLYARHTYLDVSDWSTSSRKSRQLDVTRGE